MPEAHFTIKRHHPSLAGHFPGRPIVPGVVLLDEVLALMSGASAAFVRLASVKFIAPVLPEQNVALAWSEQSGGRMDFICRVSGQDVLRGHAFALRAPE